MPEPEADIHIDEIVGRPSEAQAFHMSTRICIVLERYGFLISE